MFGQVASAFAAWKGNCGGDSNSKSILVSALPKRSKSVSPTFSSLLRGFLVVHAKEGEKKSMAPVMVEARREAEEAPSFRRVVVGGGSGFVGTELVRHLRRRGYEVYVISRSPEPTKHEHEEHERLTWDDLARDGFPERTSAVVNLAGRNFLDPLKRWTEEFKKDVYDSRVDTARAVATAIEKADAKSRPEVFVQISGVGFYPPDGGKTLYDESSPGGRGDFFSELVTDWEGAARLSSASSAGWSVRQVFVRPGVVLGRRGGLIQRIFLPFYLGGGGRMGSGEQPMPWIHVKDLVGIITFAIENERVKGVLNGTAPQIVTNSEFVKAFAGSLWRPAIVPLPDIVWNLVFGEERASIITNGQRVACKRTLDLGYQFRYPTISEACDEFAQLLYVDADAGVDDGGGQHKEHLHKDLAGEAGADLKG